MRDPYITNLWLKWSLNRARKIAPKIQRDKFVKHSQDKQKRRCFQNQNTIVFSTTFSPQYHPVTNIVKKYLTILETDDTLSCMRSNSIKCAARRAMTIGNRVSPSLYTTKKETNQTWLSTNGSYKCGHTKCQFITVTKEFCSFSKPELSPFKSKHYINCNSQNIIYLINCGQCQLQ